MCEHASYVVRWMQAASAKVMDEHAEQYCVFLNVATKVNVYNTAID